MIDPARLAADHPDLGQARRLLVGYSGGLDSTVLLHLVRAAFPDVPLLALHVNHRLSPFADQWQQHCVNQCARWNIALVTESVELQSGGLEAAARTARYEVFRRHVEAGDLLLQAHHADDQAETVLFRLLRSAGTRGLAGIPSTRSLGAGRLVRPLLSWRRAELLEYARAERLSWIEDESNRDDRFDRNFLRLRVLPLLEQRWPHAVSALSASAAHVGEAGALLEEWGREHLRAAGERAERLGWSLSLDWLQACSHPVRHHTLRVWAQLRGLAAPGPQVLEALEKELLQARADAAPCLHWPDASLRRFRDRLYLIPDVLPESFSAGPLAWPDFPEPLVLPEGFRLVAEPDRDGPLWLPEGGQLEVRFRQGGERCLLPGRQHSHALKKLLQAWPLEPWLRDRVPLIHCDAELVAVGDLWVCRSHDGADAATAGRIAGQHWRVCWYREGGIG